MARDAPSTSEHRGPAQPEGGRGRPALVCAFPRPIALPLPDSGTVVGRAWLAERGLADTEVSSGHLRVDRAGGALRVADVGSRNGTWVNGSRLAPRDLTPLDDGAVLRLGRTLFVFREELRGLLDPAPPVGGLVGPYGLRGVTQLLSGLGRSRPGNVLVEGETGVGKELVARAAAAALGRERPFAAVNVAGVARGVFESQMFGHVAGAFSDAPPRPPASWWRTTAGRCSSTRSESSTSSSRPSSCASWRTARCCRSAPSGRRRSTCSSSPRPTATSRPWSSAAPSGATSSRGWRWRASTSRRSASGAKIPAGVAFELARRAGSALRPSRSRSRPWSGCSSGPGRATCASSTRPSAAVRRLDPEPGLRLWAVDEVLGEVGGHKLALTEETVAAAIVAAGGNVTAAAATLGVSRGKLLRHRKRAHRD